MRFGSGAVVTISENPAYPGKSLASPAKNADNSVVRID
jgi:hypothetical protein